MLNSYLKLIDLIDTPQTINVCVTKDGRAQYTHRRLLPGVKYSFGEYRADYDAQKGNEHTATGKIDERLLNSLKNTTVRKAATPMIVAKLTEAGVPFEKKKCPTCGGAVEHVIYNIVEVVLDDAEL